ncbi:MAG: DUF4981 domain-containing protein, partial [Bacteroidaceae bacterium]
YQYIHFKPCAFMTNRLTVTNWFDFINLDNYYLQWTVEANGTAIDSGKLDFPTIKPHSSVEMEIPFKTIVPDNREYFLKVEALPRTSLPYASKGHIAAFEQWQLPVAKVEEQPKQAVGEVKVKQTTDAIRFDGKQFTATFSTSNGEMTSLIYNNKSMILSGLQPNFWRALTDNDVANGTSERCGTWNNIAKKMNLIDIKVSNPSTDGNVQLITKYALPEQESTLDIAYIVCANGNIRVKMSFVPGNKPLPEIPRFGMRMILPKEYDQMSWFGRGPHENYADRKTSAAIGLYHASVWEQYHPYVRAQETGNKCDVRRLTLCDTMGNGLLITGAQPLSISAWNFPMEAINYKPFAVERKHGGSVEKQELVWLNIDMMQMGVGGDNTWGAQVHPEYTITPKAMSYSFTIQPTKQALN